MSGLAAAVRLVGEPLGPDVVPTMIAAIAYRGPDRSGFWHDGVAALGVAQLRTTLEAEDEIQPLSSPDGAVTMIFDGYLSNWEDLRRELQAEGARLRSPSDTELVLQAYLRWGDDFAAHLDGEFAVVLWDARRRTLLAVRDPVGTRPLVYWYDRGLLLVASDPVAILAALPERPPLSQGYLVQVVADAIFCAEETAWEGIRRVPAAHILGFDNGRIREVRYWEPNLEATIVHRRDADYYADYRAVLADCVRRAARSHAPTAFHVSGGLDSSALFCMAHHLLETAGLPAPGIAGYTLATPAGSEADEERYVQAIERDTGRHVARIPMFLPPLELFADEARQNAEVPPYPNAAMSYSLIDAAVAAGSRVIVSGLGGDNWLDGQPIYYGEDLAAGRFGAVLACLSSDAKELGARATVDRFLRASLLRLLPEEAQAALRSLIGRPVADPLDHLGWLAPHARELLAERQNRRNSMLRHYPPHHRYKIDKLTSPEFLIALREIERQNACRGAELRSPMFGREFIEFSMATPERLRRRGNRYKLIHRHALHGIIPPEISARHDKAYFDLTFRRLFPELRVLAIEPVPAVLKGLLEDERHGAALAAEAESLDDAPIRPVWAYFSATMLARLMSDDAR